VQRRLGIEVGLRRALEHRIAGRLKGDAAIHAAACTRDELLRSARNDSLRAGSHSTRSAGGNPEPSLAKLLVISRNGSKPTCSVFLASSPIIRHSSVFILSRVGFGAPVFMKQRQHYH
jgi:hypothetical protein